LEIFEKKIKFHHSQGSFPKKNYSGTPSSSAEGARIEVWGGEGVLALTRNFFSILDLKWANFGVNSAVCTVHLKLVGLV